MRDIMTKVWRCTKCSDCYYGIESFNEHKCKILNNATPVREFGWLVPTIGLLHLEMNAARSFVKLNWDIFVKDVGKELGFKSPKALDYLRKGSDHHKTWQLLEILYQSLTLEMTIPYVKECNQNKQAASVDGYWTWSNSLEDPNYIYIQHMTLTYLHSLMTLRAGVRKCNNILVDSASAKLSHLFFARNHPIYRNIVFHHYCDLFAMPQELKQFRDVHVSSSKTGKIEKCQGGKCN